MENFVKIFQRIIWKSFLKKFSYSVGTLKSRQFYNQVSRQASSDKINSSNIPNHVNRLIKGRMHRINTRCTRTSNVLVQMILIENYKHLIFSLMKILSIKYRHSMSKTPQSRLIHLPPMVIKPRQWRPKL